MRTTILDIPFPNLITTQTTLKRSYVTQGGKLGDKRSQTATKGINFKNTVYQVKWAILARADMLTLRNAFDSVGSWGAFRWHPFEENSLKYYALQENGEIDIVPVSASDYEVSAVIEEVFDVHDI